MHVMRIISNFQMFIFHTFTEMYGWLDWYDDDDDDDEKGKTAVNYRMENENK